MLRCQCLQVFLQHLKDKQSESLVRKPRIRGMIWHITSGPAQANYFSATNQSIPRKCRNANAFLVERLVERRRNHFWMNHLSDLATKNVLRLLYQIYAFASLFTRPLTVTHRNARQQRRVIQEPLSMILHWPFHKKLYFISVTREKDFQYTLRNQVAKNKYENYRGTREPQSVAELLL